VGGSRDRADEGGQRVDDRWRSAERTLRQPVSHPPALGEEAPLPVRLLRAALLSAPDGALPEPGPLDLGSPRDVASRTTRGRRGWLRALWAAAQTRPQGGLLDGAALPALATTARRVEIDPKAASRAAAACGVTYDGRALPPAWPEVLFVPLLAQLLVDPAFPLSPLGLIHTRQRFSAPRPLRSTERPDLRCWIDRARASDRGITLTVGMVASVEGRAVWTGEADLLSRAPTARTPGGRARAAKPVPRGQGLPLVAPADAGRRYARATGDWSPHHLWPITARLLGYPRPIAHGMWTLARCLELVADRLPRGEGVRADVRFQVPLSLPGRAVLLASELVGAPPHLTVRLLDPDTGAPHLRGEIGSCAG